MLSSPGTSLAGFVQWGAMPSNLEIHGDPSISVTIQVKQVGLICGNQSVFSNKTCSVLAAVRKQGNDICIWIIRIIFDGRHGKNQPVSFWTMGIRARSCDSVQSKKAHGPEALALASLNLQQISTHCRTQRKANSKFTWPCYTPHCRAAWPNCKSSSFLLTAPATMNEGKNSVKILSH